ncbi:hypothetical protein F511_11970 [Dorcoceras hygrometricum]|uniref:Uncharacterized protein n=1 Tax=Dorcoceras hygrometricum TaxID=472368 RepID=A0A2Z7CQY9_9LAMI|nr:hypothetical protein F511_11970 [Dorcoceras hygrometricum]
MSREGELLSRETVGVSSHTGKCPTFLCMYEIQERVPPLRSTSTALCKGCKHNARDVSCLHKSSDASPIVAYYGGDGCRRIRVRFRRGSLRNGYHIQGRQQALKLPNPNTARRTTAKAFAKDVFINQERKLGARRRSDTVLVSTINDADQGSVDVTLRTPPATYEKSKSLGSGGSMVARLKLKGIDGRAPPGVEPAA